MYPEGAAAEGASLRDHLRVVLRRKWIILLALMTVPTVAVILSMRQEALYQATSQVLLNRQNLSGILSGVTDPNTYYQPERLAQTQAELARVPEVGQRVITAAGLTDRTPAGVPRLVLRCGGTRLRPHRLHRRRHGSRDGGEAREHLRIGIHAIPERARRKGDPARAAGSERAHRPARGAGRHLLGRLSQPCREGAAAPDDRGAPDVHSFRRQGGLASLADSA